MTSETAPELVFRYTNHQGVRAVRTVLPMANWFGISEYHKGEQWFLQAWDVEKDAVRDFALRDIEFKWSEKMEAV